MKKSLFLSVCIITKNEEKFIKTCLNSVKNIADEIIVVDSFSTDRTKEIALKFNVLFFERAWNNNFSDARNYAISKASGKWILVIDADEYLQYPKQLKKEIKNRDTKNIGGFKIERKDISIRKTNSKIVYNASSAIRVFRNLPEIYYHYEIHEKINELRLLDSGIKVKILKNSRLIHQIFDYKTKDLDIKQAYYLDLLKKSLKKNPNDPWLSFHRAKTLWYFEKLDKSFYYFKKLATKKGVSKKIKASALNNAASIAIEKGEYRKAHQLIKNSISIISTQSLSYEILFLIHYKQGKYKKAISSIRKVKNNKKACSYNSSILGSLYCYKEVQSFKIGSCYLALGKIKKAKSYFLKGIEENPKMADNYYGMSIIYLFKNNSKKAKKHIKKCLKLNPKWTDALILKNKINTYEIIGK